MPPAQVTSGGSQPRWVNDLYSVYDRRYYLAALGTGDNLEQAEVII